MDKVTLEELQMDERAEEDLPVDQETMDELQVDEEAEEDLPVEMAVLEELPVGKEVLEKPPLDERKEKVTPWPCGDSRGGCHALSGQAGAARHGFCSL